MCIYLYVGLVLFRHKAEYLFKLTSLNIRQLQAAKQNYYFNILHELL